MFWVCHDQGPLHGHFDDHQKTLVPPYRTRLPMVLHGRMTFYYPYHGSAWSSIAVFISIVHMYSFQQNILKVVFQFMDIKLDKMHYLNFVISLCLNDFDTFTAI